jgi:hypothetical protein
LKISEREIYRDFWIHYQIAILDTDEKVIFKCTYTLAPLFDEVDIIHEYLSNIEASDFEIGAQLLTPLFQVGFRNRFGKLFSEQILHDVFCGALKLGCIQRFAFGFNKKDEFERDYLRGSPCLFLFLAPKDIKLDPNAMHQDDRLEFFTMGVQVYFDQDGSFQIRPKPGTGYFDSDGKPTLSGEGAKSHNSFTVLFGIDSVTVKFINELLLNDILVMEHEAVNLTFKLLKEMNRKVDEIVFSQERLPPPIKISQPNSIDSTLAGLLEVLKRRCKKAESDIC